MEKLITIVIPTYNMEKYLDKCLTSLIVPDEYMELLEVLVVNDGSKDNSSAIAHRYEDKYPQTFRVIDKENGNYGSCVNRGLKEAAGKYIKILDADDSFDNENWKKFLDVLDSIEADLILTDYNMVAPNGETIEHRRFNIIPSQLHEAPQIISALIEVEMHAVTYRKALIQEIKYQQSEGISYTDTEWVVIPMVDVQTVVYHPIMLYKYLVGREGQTMDPKIHSKKRHERLQIHYRLLAFYEKRNSCRGSMHSYLQTKLHGIFLRNYVQSLIQNDFPSKELIAFDKTLRQKAPDIHRALDNVTFSNIRIVSLWRQNGYSIPFTDLLMIHLIRYKQRWLPWLRVGRAKRTTTTCNPTMS